MSDVRERRVRLSAATLDQLDAYFRDPTELAEALGSPLPTGWPVDATSFLYVANALERSPEAAARWMHWIVDADTGRLIGDGGFRTKSDGALELTYEIGAEFRGQGWASAAVDALCDLGFADAAVPRIDAHISPSDAASAVILSRAGFAPTWVDDADGEARGLGRVDSWSRVRSV